MGERILIQHNHKWFHLGTIISISYPLTTVLIGHQLADQYGPGTGICSILVGNLILWILAMAVISMSSEERSNAIQNVKIYLGTYGAVFMWLVLLISLINWFAFQINTTISSLSTYFEEYRNDILIRIGATIGFFITLLSTGGIRLIKWLTITSSPFVFSYYIYSILHSDYSISSIDSWGISIPAIVSIIFALLPGIINLPTIFRHSRSKADSYLGLSTMFLIVSFFQIATIWMKFTNSWTFIFTSPIYSFFTILLILLTLIFMNLVNIYLASVCWETYVPRFEGPKGYVIIGLMGTAAYTFLQIKTPIILIANLTNSYLASLGIVILVASLIRIIVRHRPRKFEKIINGFCWLIGCIISTYLVIINIEDPIRPILMGIMASAFSFLVIIFIEETLWSARKILFNAST